MQLACTHWNGPAYGLDARTRFLEPLRAGLVRGEVGEDRDQFGRVAAPRVVDSDVGVFDGPAGATTYRAGMVNVQLGSPLKAARSTPQPSSTARRSSLAFHRRPKACAT